MCQIHHLIPRSQGGPTALHNLITLCAFHHQVVIHRRGWTLTLHPNGTTTAASPDGRRVFHSHGPPRQAA
jgi:5-methylcytosine-specific restriction endonuclease McrA